MGDDRQHDDVFVSTRGRFIKRMVAAGFSIPLIGSFGFGELASASAGTSQSYGNQQHHHHRVGDGDNDADDYPPGIYRDSGYDDDSGRPPGIYSDSGGGTGGF